MNVPAVFDAEPQAMAQAVADELIADEQEQQERARAERLQVFGARLATIRDDWVRARAANGWDQRWREDLDAYEGRDPAAKQGAQMMESVQQGYPIIAKGAQPSRSTVFVGLSRVKTTQAEARVCEILLPTDDRNWGVDPTPDPSVSRAMESEEVPVLDGRPLMGPDGQPMRKREIAAQMQRMAKRAAEAMQVEIDDQLTECDYNGEARKAIHNAAKLGTGVLKGPIVISRSNRAFRSVTDARGVTVRVIEIEEDLVPASYCVPTQNVFPDPACGEEPKRGKGLFELDRITLRQLRDLAKQPGYIADQIREVIKEGPQPSAFTADPGEQLEQQERNKDTYEVWEYWGEVEYEDLRSAGVRGLPEEDDPLRSFNACVVMVNQRVVKAYLNPLEDPDSAIPYDFMRWSKVDGQPFGYGVPRLMQSQQKILNAAWRALMDNMGLTSGPMIVLDPQAVTPGDNQWTLSARKIWFRRTDSDVPINQIFHSVEFNSRQEELANIIAMAEKLADVELGLPQLMAGEQGGAPETVGGMTLLANTANTLLRRIVKQWDDDITRPHIGRYYAWNMLYNDDESIKGDFQCVPRGSSALLVRDQQNQEFIQLLAAANSPIYGPMIDPKKLFQKALQARYVDPAEIMLPDEEIERRRQRGSQQMPPPQLMAAQIRAKTEIEKARLAQQAAAGEAQMRVALAQREHEARMMALQAQRELELIKLANQRQMSIDQIKAMLGATAIKERTRRDLFAAEQQLKVAMGSGI